METIAMRLVEYIVRTGQTGNKYCDVTFEEGDKNAIYRCFKTEMFKGTKKGQKLNVKLELGNYNGRTMYYIREVSPEETDANGNNNEEQATPAPSKTPIRRVAGNRRIISGTQSSTERQTEEDTSEIESDSEQNDDFVEDEAMKEKLASIPVMRWENPDYKPDENGFTLFEPNQIKVKPTVVTESGAKFLLFAPPEVYEKALNDKYGVLGWMRKFKEITGNVYCTLSIKSGDLWIEKDAGTDGQKGPEKGRAYDSAFERACRSIGLGSELWTAPNIFIPSSRLKMDRNEKGNFVVLSQIRVNDIKYDKNGITDLSLSSDDKVVWTM